MSRHLAGFRAWILQRISAIYLGVFSLVAIAYLLFAPPADFQQWSQLLASPLVMLAVLLAIALTLLHAWIGIRDVLIDYLPHTGLRLLFLSLVGLMLSACGFWSLLILLANH